ncbi:VanZ family protein, partial [Priestia flexa]|uniref:VanZ family protein n=1 Tax=Priestia flexa TaxID=86664 RepID=A0A8I1MEN4_9BACI|nr:VanZ family protein [Priestia flexa]MBN8250844.1 VanZ family protein [Priestia flexa]
MLKRVLLIGLLLAISNFSHTPHLKVTDPGTWQNESVWDHTATLQSILDPSGEFFTQYTYAFDAEFVLRKIAHLSFFGLLALLIYWNLPKMKGRFVLAWLLLAGFAFMDEVHQAFIVGRDGRIIDVIIDSVGGALFLYLYDRFKKSKKEAGT